MEKLFLHVVADLAHLPALVAVVHIAALDGVVFLPSCVDLLVQRRKFIAQVFRIDRDRVRSLMDGEGDQVVRQIEIAAVIDVTVNVEHAERGGARDGTDPRISCLRKPFPDGGGERKSVSGVHFPGKS